MSDQPDLVAFATWVMSHWPDGDIDGGELQEAAHKHGLLRAESVSEPCGEDCGCVEYHGLTNGRFDRPITCFRRVPLEARVSGGRWLPIESAPRDGSDVLLWLPASGGALRGCWDDDRYAKKPRPFWTNDCDRLWGRTHTREHQPTHWMPLPPPPVSAPIAGAEQ